MVFCCHYFRTCSNKKLFLPITKTMTNSKPEFLHQNQLVGLICFLSLGSVLTDGVPKASYKPETVSGDRKRRPVIQVMHCPRQGSVDKTPSKLNNLPNKPAVWNPKTYQVMIATALSVVLYAICVLYAV